MPDSKCIVAAAGSGKTTYIVRKALEVDSDKQVLITTYTRENESEIRKKILEENQVIPGNIAVQTWWAFLFQHGVRPYQNLITEKPIKGLKLMAERSGVKYRTKRFPVYWAEEEAERFYFSEGRRVYSDKIALFVIRCNEITKGAVVDRLSKIFDHIFIDEVQDLAGYDLDIISSLLNDIPTILVGDPRQVTYHTHHSAKHRKYKDGLVELFVKEKCSKSCKIDDSILKDSYRCHQTICEYSNTLFPDLPQVNSLSKLTTAHDGVFFIAKNDVEQYLATYSPVQLRYNRRTKANDAYPAYNFGESKGLTFNRVLIYPTASIKKHIEGKKSLPVSTLCKLYVALTRARHSVAIVWDKPPVIDGVSPFSFEKD